MICGVIKVKISAIVPAYNAEAYLEKCIKSIQNQTYSNWEAIIVDDVSKDRSYELMSCYAAQDNRIRVYTKANQGPGLTRNYALERAMGDVIVFIDSDDYVEPDYFEKVAEAFYEEHTDVVFIDVIQEKPDGSVICEELMSRYSKYSKKELISYQMCRTMPWGGCRKAVRRDLIERNGIRYSADPVGEEAIYSFNVLRYAHKISFIAKPLYHYINYPVSQSKAGGEDPWGPVALKMKGHLVHEELLDDYQMVVNAFAFSALIVWVLRYSDKHSLQETLKVFRKKRKTFEDEYSWDIAGKFLRKEAKMLLLMVKHNILLPVVVAAKFRNIIGSKA